MIRYRTLYINDSDGENDMKTQIVDKNNTIVESNTRYITLNESYTSFTLDDDSFKIGDSAEIVIPIDKNVYANIVSPKCTIRVCCFVAFSSTILPVFSRVSYTVVPGEPVAYENPVGNSRYSMSSYIKIIRISADQFAIFP